MDKNGFRSKNIMKKTKEIYGSSGVIVGEKHPQPQYLC